MVSFVVEQNCSLEGKIMEHKEPGYFYLLQEHTLESANLPTSPHLLRDMPLFSGAALDMKSLGLEPLRALKL